MSKTNPAGVRTTASVLTCCATLLTALPAAAQQTVQLPARDRPLTERPTPVYTVGTEEGASWEMFSGIRGLGFDAKDNLYVLDAQNHRVIMLDARGRFVRQFGKRGGGPGELQLPVGISTMHDGSIVVSDLGNRAFIVYSPEGEHLRNVPFADDVGFPMGVVADQRGAAVVARTRSRMTEGGSSEADRIIRVPLAGSAAPTTLFTLTTAQPQVVDQSGGGVNRRFVVNMDPVFGPRPLFATLPDGSVAIQQDSEFAVRIIDPSGRHTRTLTRAYPQRKVTKRDEEAWRTRQREARESGRATTQTIVLNAPGGGASGGAPSGNIPVPDIQTSFAEVMAVVTNLRADPQGRLWIQRRNQDGMDQGPIDLVDGAGRYIGTLPAQQLPSAVSASGLAAYVVRDDLGVERVAVRRLPQSWR